MNLAFSLHLSRRFYAQIFDDAFEARSAPEMFCF